MQVRPVGAVVVWLRTFPVSLSLLTGLYVKAVGKHPVKPVGSRSWPHVFGGF